MKKPLIIIILVVVIGGLYWWIKKNEAMTPPLDGGSTGACTADAKQCPDGSYVSRVQPSCEFAACPETAILGWKTFSNEQFGFNINYPNDFSLFVSEPPQKQLNVEFRDDDGYFVLVSANKLPDDLFNATLEEYLEFIKREGQKYQSVSLYRPVKELSKENLFISGSPAIKTVYDQRSIGGVGSRTDVIFLRNSSVFRISEKQTTELEKKDIAISERQHSIFDKMLETVRFVN